MSEKSISEMNKDELEAYALAEFGTEIDKTKKLVVLREEVEALANKKSGKAGKKKVAAVATVKYVKHPSNGRVYKATPHLLGRGDMVPCDKDGVSVGHAEEEVGSE